MAIKLANVEVNPESVTYDGSTVSMIKYEDTTVWSVYNTPSKIATALNNGVTFSDEEVNSVCHGNYGALIKVKAGGTVTTKFNNNTYSVTADNSEGSTDKWFWVGSSVNYTTLYEAFIQQPSLMEVKYLYVPSTVTSLERVFYNRYQNPLVTRLNASDWDTSGVTAITNFFGYCKSITTTNVNWDFRAVKAVTNFVLSASALANVSGTISNLGKGFTSAQTLDLSTCIALTRDSALVFINGLSSESNYTNTIKFSDQTYALLTADDKTLITSKGWICSNT